MIVLVVVAVLAAIALPSYKLWVDSGRRADVTAALDLTPAALFDNPRGQSYVYPDGRKVDRTPTKQFKQRGC